MFGPVAGGLLDVMIEDWARDPFTSSPADIERAGNHPSQGLPSSLEEVWNGHLQFASTELAAQSGGVLEGALEAAEFAFSRLKFLRR